MAKHRIGIIGATGYTGSELARILVNHPDIEIAFITSESRAGETFSAVHPAFQGILDLPLQSVEEALSILSPPELVFLALPHGVSMQYVARLQDQPFSIIDFSGDFRLSSAEVYQQWYQKPHTYLAGFEQAVYGLPELYAEQIKTAKLVANPGCFPTSAILALAPLLQAGNHRLSSLIIDSKTGVTGAGVKASGTTHFSNAHDNFKAYGIKSHRHTIEIQEILGQASQSRAQVPPVLFTPHLLPLDRGILSTIYIPTPDPCSQAQLMDVYREFYADKPFVRICGHSPSLKEVRGSNFCNLYIDYDPRTQTILILSAIDNLVKGAAGQAVQNMNLILGLPETQGLNLIPMQP
jgi:N-acetyl-gamma-glutamyl-phosphate reductase